MDQGRVIQSPRKWKEGKLMAHHSMNSTQLREMQDLLQDRCTILQVDLDSLERETMGMDGEPMGNHSLATRQMEELASEASEKAVMYGRMDSESGEVQEIREALERLKKGTFGSCETCGFDIPLERLQAIPYARLCVRCKSEEERK
jgi:DnaK suppressor protein